MSQERGARPSHQEQGAIAAALAREAEPDKDRLRALGIVHTPLFLVRFALARIEQALIRDLDLTEGWASSSLEVIDPAVGTGVWLSSLLSLLSGRHGGPASIQGFDADAAAVETARALLEPAPSAAATRLSLHAVNTLSLPDPWPARAGVRVILGNPPWGARSLSRGVALSDDWLREFHHDPDGTPLHERRSGVLSDDYVRFFRWALEQARRAELGAVLCFVTNASYLDGPVHRGMRGALAMAFDRIEIVDLGGNTLRSRGEERDETLFPVRVGAALTLCVRGVRRSQPATLSYAQLGGTRAEKEQSLLAGMPMRCWDLHAPAFLFRPGPAQRAVPAAGFSLDEAFPFHGEGIQTNRDSIATAQTEDELLDRLRRIAQGEIAVPATGHFDPNVARTRLREALAGPREALVGKLAYRPFQTRFYCRLAPLCHRPRPLLSRAAEQSSLCLLSTRKALGAGSWNMFALVDACADSSFLSVRSSCRTRVFPSHDADGAPNLAARVYDELGARIGRAAAAEEVIAYAAGVLGAPSFRSAYEATLKLDYPRLPWPTDASTFEACVAAGKRFMAVLGGEVVSPSTLSLQTSLPLDTWVSRRALRWCAPHLLELDQGTQIGARDQRGFRAHVGHHAIIESAYRDRGSATIAALLEACERSAMWVEAERAADEAYRPARSVGSHAKAVAVAD